MKRQISESRLPDNLLYFHGSAKPKMSHIDRPTYEHPFYCTTDAEYAMAFSTKTHSSTGHSYGAIEFSKTNDSNYVYIISIDAKANLLDVRNFGTKEFDALAKCIPSSIMKFIDGRAEKYRSVSGGKKNYAQYSGIGNDVWYIFENIKNTVLCINTTNPNNPEFSKNTYLRSFYKDVSYDRVRYAVKPYENELTNAYRKFYTSTLDTEHRKSIALEKCEGQEFLNITSNYMSIKSDDNMLSQLCDEVVKHLVAKDKVDSFGQLTDDIVKCIYWMFCQYKASDTSKKYPYRISEFISKLGSYLLTKLERALIQKTFNELDDDLKNNMNIRYNMFMRASMSRSGSLVTTNMNVSLLDYIDMANDIEHDKILSKITYDTTTHLLMSEYFKLFSKDYDGVITGENDKNEDTDSMVSTSCAIGIWNIEAIDSACIIPMKYKWLKKVLAKARALDKNATLDDKIRRYITLYKSMAK